MLCNSLDVLLHRAGRCFSVALAQCEHDALMVFQESPWDVRPGSGSHTPRPSQFAESAADTDQKCVAGRFDDPLMELGVEIDSVHDPLALACRALPLQQIVERRQCRVVDARRGNPGRGNLDHGARLKQCPKTLTTQAKPDGKRSQQRLEFDGTDARPAAMGDFDDAQERQRPQGLANTAPADSETRSKLSFGGKRLSRNRLTRQDCSQQLLGDSIGDGSIACPFGRH